MDGSISNFEFTNKWFNITALEIWNEFIPKIQPKKVLEIGSYEGASACYLIEANKWHDDMEIFCVDTWQGGVEHQSKSVDMRSVEERFKHNVSLACNQASKSASVVKMKGTSDHALSKLVAEGHASSFDFIYVDGSHQAPDVLLDALLAFKLCKVGGVIAFDDYVWWEEMPYGRDPLRSPKFAIDSFTNVFFRKIKVLKTKNSQVHVVKTSE